MGSLRSVVRMLCNVTVINPNKNVIYHVEIVIVLSSVYSITLLKNFATIDKPPRIIKRLPQNFAK